MAPPVRLRAATRGSELARWQTDHVAALVRAAAATHGVTLEIESVVIETDADRRQDVQIWEMGGKGVFVKQVQAAVLDGRADFAVHSAKDLPAETHDDLVMAAVPERADARDMLVGATLRTLAPGATIATGSIRRRSQLAWLKPDLTFTGLRGNIATRLRRVPPGGAIVVAAAAIGRLAIDLTGVEHELLSPEVMLPQVAQGALAVECRRDDEATFAWLHPIEHASSRQAVDAERCFLAELGGDCDLPAGAHAGVSPRDDMRIEGMLASPDGHVVLRHAIVGNDGEEAGRAVARHLLTSAGGGSLLAR